MGSHSVMMRTQKAYVDPCSECLMNQQPASSIEKQARLVTRVNSPNKANRSKTEGKQENYNRVHRKIKSQGSELYSIGITRLRNSSLCKLG